MIEVEWRERRRRMGRFLIARPIGRRIPKKATPILHFLSSQIVPTFF